MIKNGRTMPVMLVRAYCNLVASVYMHDRLLARLLPAYGIFYISSLSAITPRPEVGQTYGQGLKSFFCFITFILPLLQQASAGPVSDVFSKLPEDYPWDKVFCVTLSVPLAPGIGVMFRLFNCLLILAA